MTSKKRSAQDADKGQTGDPAKAPGDIEALVGLRGGGNTLRTSEYMNGRRSLAYELHDQGLLSSQKLAVEILYLLPDEFTQLYEQLFHMALKVGDNSVMHGQSGGLEKASGAQGMVTGSENKLQSAGGGKRWKNPAFVVDNELALDTKRLLDKELIREIRKAMINLRTRTKESKRLRDNAESGTTGLRYVRDQAGSGTSGTSGTSGLSKMGAAALRCGGFQVLHGTEIEIAQAKMRIMDEIGTGTRKNWPVCGKFMGEAWAFCPSCGTSRGWTFKPTEADEEKTEMTPTEADED